VAEVAEVVESTRVDRWLWSVRLCKTRASATAACRAGHVQVNGLAARAASPVRVGDRVEAFLHGRQRVVEVVAVIAARVGAPRAAECLVDHSPPPPERERAGSTPTRDRGAGRPTKQERRRLDRLRDR
jgi:ribosome-associated heat shock protein Hsp15